MQKKYIAHVDPAIHHSSPNLALFLAHLARHDQHTPRQSQLSKGLLSRQIFTHADVVVLRCLISSAMNALYTANRTIFREYEPHSQEKKRLLALPSKLSEKQASEFEDQKRTFQAKRKEVTLQLSILRSVYHTLAPGTVETEAPHTYLEKALSFFSSQCLPTPSPPRPHTMVSLRTSRTSVDFDHLVQLSLPTNTATKLHTIFQAGLALLDKHIHFVNQGDAEQLALSKLRLALCSHLDILGSLTTIHATPCQLEISDSQILQAKQTLQKGDLTLKFYLKLAQNRLSATKNQVEIDHENTLIAELQTMQIAVQNGFDLCGTLRASSEEIQLVRFRQG